MDLDLISNLVRILNGSATLESIEHANGEWRVRLVKGRPSVVSASTPSTGNAIAASSLDEGEVREAPDAPLLHSVIAGLVGTFYRSPAPNEPPFVSVGDIVQVGQTLAVVEAMKLLNAIDAPHAGRIAQIPISDGASVSMETVLFHIEPIKAADV